jgi:hypothetical protein
MLSHQVPISIMRFVKTSLSAICVAIIQSVGVRDKKTHCVDAPGDPL